MSRLNSISAVVTLFRDQIHSLDSNSTGITSGVEGTTSPGAEENEVKKKQSGAAAPSIGVISEMGSSSEQEAKKKASVHGNVPTKDENVGAEHEGGGLHEGEVHEDVLQDEGEQDVQGGLDEDEWGALGARDGDEQGGDARDEE